jgi:putative Holliday junction resolvase
VLGIDFGERRIGIALSDPSRIIAQPFDTLSRKAGKRPPTTAILALATEHDVSAFVVGLPLSLDGSETDWTAEVRAFGDALARRSVLPVEYVDERMTSVAAERAVRSIGLPRRERGRKERIDAAAAALILQVFLDRDRGGTQTDGADGA